MKNSSCWIVVVLATAAGPVAAFPIDSNNIYQISTEVTVGGSDYRTTVVANCNPGDVVLAGSCYNWNAPAKLLQSMLWFNGWRCDYQNYEYAYPQYPPINPFLFVIPGDPPIRGAIVTCAHP